MKAHFHSPFQWVMVWSVLWSLPIRGEPLSRGEIAKLGKATTAFVDVKPGRGSGSAFCIHSSGLFLTNEHVIRSADNGGSIDLVLNSGLKERRIISATVVRANKDLDLALLRVEGVEKLPSLNLGSADDLTELMELVAFGFPFGAALAPQKQEYPAISVNVGNVTSLRRKEEDLHRIQMDAALNPGNSGGPVLDRNGKVVGMVVSGVQGSGVNFAIPVNHMRRFLAEPFIHFKLPVLSRADIHKSLVFEIRAMPLLPSPSPLSIELSLSTPDGKEQKHQMDKDKEKDTYRLETVAFPPPTSPQNLQVVVQLASGSISGTVEDRIFTLGNRQHRLIEVNRIRTQPQGQVLFQDGYIMEGVLGGMDAVPIRFAKQEFKVNFHRAAEVLVEPPAEIDSVTCTIVVSQGGKEVARQQKNLTVSGPRHSHRKRSPPIQVPLLEKESVIRHLPATIGNVAVGGSGRYLILHLPQIRKLAVFDVNLARVVHYLALAEDNIKFTAGAEEILVVLVNSNLLQRWSLTTFERKAIVPLPTKGIVKAMCMGSASIGPVLIHSSDNVLGPRELPCLFLDLKTLKSFKNRFSGIMNFFPHETLEFRASADGRVFTVWRTSGNPSGMGILTWTEEEYRGAYHHD
ncbi:MAG TPA: serine protease, partial [Gemmataceae bacterium]|nr:serine protease [Gemmataceae bacterium]